MTRAWAWLVLGVALRAAAAGPSVVLLVTEDRLEGAPRFWWACGERAPQPVSDALAAWLRKRNARVIDGCTGGSDPFAGGTPVAVHPSYQRPHLLARDGANVASALDADLAVVGTVRASRAEAPEGLGVVRYRAECDLQVVRADGSAVAKVAVTRDGFGADVAAALETARQLLLADVLAVVPEALEARAERPVLWVRLAIGGNADTRLRFREALVQVKGVTRVQLAAVRKTSTTFAVEPPDARYAIAAALAQAGVTYELTEGP